MNVFDAAEIVRGIGDLYEPLADDKGLTLAVEARAPTFVRGNRELISQALANLVDNAIKYGATAPAQASGGPAAIVLKATERGDRILLSVADHGPGIAPSDRGRVLERFVRLEQSRSQPGSGPRPKSRRRHRAPAWRRAHHGGQSSGPGERALAAAGGSAGAGGLTRQDFHAASLVALLDQSGYIDGLYKGGAAPRRALDP
jgi:hypothetical protein